MQFVKIIFLGLLFCLNSSVYANELSMGDAVSTPGGYCFAEFIDYQRAKTSHEMTTDAYNQLSTALDNLIAAITPVCKRNPKDKQCVDGLVLINEMTATLRLLAATLRATGDALVDALLNYRECLGIPVGQPIPEVLLESGPPSPNVT